VTPLPIRTLFFYLQFYKGVILSVPFAEVYAEGTVFVVIPIVIVLVLTIIESVVVVTTVFFLTSGVLRFRRSAHYRRRCQCCSKYKKAEQILIATLHVVFLLAQDFLLGILGLQGVCVFALEAMFDSAHSSNCSGSHRQETDLAFELRNFDHVF
jgi:hypothetical protein